MSVDDAKATRLQTILDAQGVKPMTSEAFDALAVLDDGAEPKAATSLADEFARHMRFNDDDDTIGWLEDHKERILAALRAVEELETWKRQHTNASCTNPICDCIEAQLARALRAVEAVRAFESELFSRDKSYDSGYRDGVEAVQALLEGD